MSKKLNTESIANELSEGSGFFRPRENRPVEKLNITPPLQQEQQKLPALREKEKPLQKNARSPEVQNAGILAKHKASIPASQHSGNLEIQQNTTATEKVTYRFHPEGKYAIEDIKTVLAQKYGIKPSYELIAEEAILGAYEDLLENQQASILAKRLSRIPENKKAS
jgi:hypothetical protein